MIIDSWINHQQHFCILLWDKQTWVDVRITPTRCCVKGRVLYFGTNILICNWAKFSSIIYILSLRDSRSLEIIIMTFMSERELVVYRCHMAYSTNIDELLVQAICRVESLPASRLEGRGSRENCSKGKGISDFKTNIHRSKQSYIWNKRAWSCGRAMQSSSGLQ